MTDLFRANGVLASGTASRAIHPAGTSVVTGLEEFSALLVAVRGIAAPQTVHVFEPATSETLVG